MISPDYWPAAVLAAVSVMMFEDLNIVFVTGENGLYHFPRAERCGIAAGISLMQNEPYNRFFIIDGKALGQYEKNRLASSSVKKIILDSCSLILLKTDSSGKRMGMVA